MNVERLNSICKSIVIDFDKIKFISSMQNTVDSLDNLVRQSNANTQNDFANSLKYLYSALEKSEYNKYSPSWLQVIDELSNGLSFGNSLKSRIETLLSENTITLSVAFDTLTKVNISLNNFYEAVVSLSKSFDVLTIDSEELFPGEAEIGFLIPRIFVDNKFENFIKELKELNLILSTFSEFTTARKEKLEVKTISSSDLTVYIGVATVTAACLAKSISWIIETYKKILEIRKLKMELRKQGVPDASLAAISDHTNGIMLEEIDKIIISIESEYSVVTDNGRKNELKNGIKICLNKIANRIDKGFNIEVRMALPAKKINPSDDETDKYTNEAKHFEDINKVSANLEFKKLDGETVLSLPESEKTTKP